MGEFNNIIAKICQELNIKCTFLSDNWLTILEKNDETRCIQGYKFPLNDHGTGNVLDDKGLFYDLMVYKKNPIIEHFVIFKNTKKQVILNYFFSHNQILVVKGNYGSCGNKVFLIKNKEVLLRTINELLKSQFSISLCPYYDIIHEYRVIVLNGELRLLYGKIKPMVVGDGKSNLLELALAFNKDYYQFKENQNFSTTYVPKKGEEILLNFQFNLSKGAISFNNIPCEKQREIKRLAFKTMKDAHIIFGSIDVIETSEHKLLLMEANSGVMMENYIKKSEDNYFVAYNIYKDAISLMFNNK